MRKIKVLLVIGSVRSQRIGPIFGEWIQQILSTDDRFTARILDLVDFDLPLTLDSNSLTGAQIRLKDEVEELISQSQAVIIITPEYNHSFSAALKNFLDWYSKPWYKKTIGFISYGGLAGGLRAVEQLRQIFAELSAVTIRQSVSFHSVWELINEQYALSPHKMHNDHAHKMLNELYSWAVDLTSS